MSTVSLANRAPTWTIQGEGGSNAIDFDVFIGMEFSSPHQVAQEPIEQGSFAAYNKQDAPKEFAVTLAVTKAYGEQQPVLEALDKLAASTDRVSLITPAAEYKSLNIEAYSYARKEDNGAGMLVVDLKLLEIREVSVKETVAPSQTPPKSQGKKGKPITKTQTKNPSNASTAKTGRTQSQPQPRKTMLKSMMDKVRSW